MAKLTILHKDRFALPMPYIIAINGHNLCIMRSRKFLIDNIPEGHYDITVKCGLLFRKREFMLSGSTAIDINESLDCTITFRNKEIIWNILFDIDLILWLAEFFITLPSPWNLVYKIASNGFFVLWLLRLYIIRKRYFVFESPAAQSTSPTATHA